MGLGRFCIRLKRARSLYVEAPVTAFAGRVWQGTFASIRTSGNSSSKEEAAMQVRDGMSEVSVTVGPSHTLRQAAAAMVARNVGAALVIDDEAPTPGIVTERDLLLSVGAGEDPDVEPVGAPHDRVGDRRRTRTGASSTPPPRCRAAASATWSSSTAARWSASSRCATSSGSGPQTARRAKCNCRAPRSGRRGLRPRGSAAVGGRPRRSGRLGTRRVSPSEEVQAGSARSPLFRHGSLTGGQRRCTIKGAIGPNSCSAFPGDESSVTFHEPSSRDARSSCRNAHFSPELDTKPPSLLPHSRPSRPERRPQGGRTQSSTSRSITSST